MTSTNSQHGPETPRHSIAVVSRRTGVNQLLLRAWERRYGVITPGRTATGRRLYSDADIEKLLLLRQLTDAEHRIGDVAHLPIPDLRALAADAPEPPPRPTTGPAALDGAGDLLDRAIDAVRTLDHAALEHLLERAAVAMSKPALRRDLIVPLMVRIGELWRCGELRVAHEHMASAIVRSFLTTMNARHPIPAAAPTLIVATPVGQWHELGALMAASHALEAGWDVLYLGASLPAEEIAGAAASRRARAVLLSLVYPAADPNIETELRQLRRLLEPDTLLMVSGQAAASHGPLLAELGAQLIRDPASFDQAINSL
ncbi:MAG: MerR family transcriptional regulator [Candidatus Latescibacteria bacterium]|nr:MerR family transcriptional regulator [Candidatus Latescibacterota bacterium]